MYFVSYLKICRLWQTYLFYTVRHFKHVVDQNMDEWLLTFHLPFWTWTPTWHYIWLAKLRTELALGYLSIWMFICARTLLHICMYVAADRNISWCLRFQCFHMIFVLIHVSNWCYSLGNTFFKWARQSHRIGWIDWICFLTVYADSWIPKHVWTTFVERKKLPLQGPACLCTEWVVSSVL